MSYVRVDDRFDDHRKIKRAWKLCRAAVGLYVMATTYTSRHMLDGLVDADWLEERIPDESERDEAVATLLEVGLFDLQSGGNYAVHDYLHYNRSRAEREAISGKRRRAGKSKAKSKQLASKPESLSQQTSSKDTRSRSRSRSRSGVVVQDLPPTSLVAELHDAARQVLAVLLAVQADRGGNVPTMRGVGLAMARYPDRDHLSVARDLEHWALAGNGANREVKDWARTLATFLRRSVPGSASRPSGRPTSPAVHDDLMIRE